MKEDKLESLLNEVVNIKDELFIAQNNMKNLQERLVKTQNELQKLCPHDEFIAEDNGDYHKPGYYYTCKFCKHFTNFRPIDKKIIYA